MSNKEQTGGKGGYRIKERQTQFGKLLVKYRADCQMSARDLEEALGRAGFPIGEGVVSKYELGTRQPSAAFIRKAVQCLNLQPAAEDALIAAHLADVEQAFWEAYLAVL